MCGVRLTPPARMIFDAYFECISFGHDKIDFTMQSAKSIGSTSAFEGATKFSFVLAPPWFNIACIMSP
jgi:hypothetical protein